MFDTLITGGTIVNADGQKRADLAISAGRITAVLSPGEAAVARCEIDAAGRWLLPGLIDAHAHLREPGLTHKEDFESGTHAAALGGVTTVLDMPTDDPWTATAAQLKEKMALAGGRLHVDVGFQAAIGRRSVGFDDLLALGPVSLELFTADVPDAYLFDKIDAVVEMLRALAGYDILVGISPGDQSILVGNEARRKGRDVDTFLASRPPLAEANGIARAVLAGAEAGIGLHIRQVNSRFGIDVWRRLRSMADVTVETTPQNLFFTSDDYATGGANLKASPPFRSYGDVLALREALSEELIDIVATDHAPHAPDEKARSYDAFIDIPGGMPGLQTLLPVMLKLVLENAITLRHLVRMCAHMPAQRFGLGRSKGMIAPGYQADILIVDLGGKTRLTNAQQASRAAYTPFDDWIIPARLTDVLLRGERIVADGKLVRPARGQVVRREI